MKRLITYSFCSLCLALSVAAAPASAAKPLSQPTSTPAATSTPAVPSKTNPIHSPPLSNGSQTYASAALGTQNGTPYGGVYTAGGVSRATLGALLSFSLALAVLGLLLIERKSLSRLLAPRPLSSRSA